MNVLIVDDSSVTRMMLKTILQSWGCNVTEAVSGEEAWQVLQANDAPRMVFLDFVLPGMSGSDLCKQIRLRSDKPYVYVILLSFKSDRETKLECLAAGADDYIVKSCDPDELEQRFRAGRRILQLHDRLHEMIRRRDEFLAMISHELRNPMGAVLLAIEAIRNVKTQFDDEHKVIHRQVTHMARLLDDLLDVARIQQNKIDLRKEPVALVALRDEVLEAVQHQFKAKNQHLHVTPCDGPLLVFGDPARLKQAQVNLLTNASKYTPEGGEVWYEIERCGEKAVITVRDSGDGIPAELLDSIFDLFVQSHSTLDRSSGGMGVGLSLAKGIIEAHDGSIIAESDGVGRGSTFRIGLPLTNKPEAPKVPAPHFSFQGHKVLLVEDKDDARTMLAKTLRLSGFEVADACDGQTALELFRTFQPDVAVIDIGLPDMDGYKLAREARQIAKAADVMLIALTGYGRQEDRQAAIEAGFDAHLVKPLDLPDLYRQISTRFTPQKAT
jgi:two-component system CheB/CheR fusion protein